MTVRTITEALKARARQDKADFLPQFFKAFPGGYGEGDRFLGVVVPDQRKVARQFRDASRSTLEKLFQSPWHECRLTGMMILVDQFQRAAKPSNPNRDSEMRSIVEFYLANLEAVNQWDIVDASSPKILGPWLVENPKERRRLQTLAKSDVIWQRRVAVLACYALIRNDEYDDIIKLSESLLHDPHDLMHKAIGWMLREVGKRDLGILRHFLEEHASEMPRTMLRYAIEKLTKSERHRWMGK